VQAGGRARGWDMPMRMSPNHNFSDISKITLDPVQFRYIYNSDITKQELKTQCLDVIINTAGITWVTTATTAATRSASTAMKAPTVAAAAWAGSSITATCAWSCSS